MAIGRGIDRKGYRRLATRALAAALIGASIVAGVARAASLEDYRRADRIRLFDNRRTGGTIFPHWLADGRRFYYRSFADHEAPGTVFLVDPAAGTKRALFTVQALAKALSTASGTAVDADELPAWRLTGDAALTARIGTTDYGCDVASLRCRAARPDAGEAIPDWAVRSPDGRWDAFVWNHNVYVRPASAPLPADTAFRPLKGDGNGNHAFPLADDSPDLAAFQPTGQRAGCDWPAPPGPNPVADPKPVPPPEGAIALTTDGEPLHSYGPLWKMGLEVAGFDADRYRPRRGSIIWSPDSSKLVVRRDDFRGMATYPLYSSTSDQPVDHSYFYAWPSAKAIQRYDLFVVDVATRRAVQIDVPSTGAVSRPGGAQWLADSRHLDVISSDRAPHEVAMSSVDAATGRATRLITERSKTYVEMSNGGWRTIAAASPGGDDLIWFSQRDGWGHLYRYGADGRLKNRIDGGENSVAELIHVDHARKLLYFTAWGRAAGNPYYRHFYRVGFDGRGMTELTPEPGDHDIEWAPDGSYFLDRQGSTDRLPVTRARAPDGRILMELSRGDDAALRAVGWHPAEEFTVKARDGKTDLHGMMYRPSHFDPNRRYPIIVNIYPGPFAGSVGRYWRFQGGDSYGLAERARPRVTHGEGMGQSLAELGFIVIKLNALGTAQRSKPMQDFNHGNLIDNGLPDQIAAVRQLAQRHGWIDTERVGITGHSAGGYAAAAGMLTHPEFFKVGVAQAGNHDMRTYGWYWGEQYMGPLESAEDQARYARQANLAYAAKLRGRLLLIHGDMDCNNPPAQTLRLADALTRENKDFDLMIVPEAGHQLPAYAMRRSWDYFVTNLAGEAAPREFDAKEPGF